MPIDGISRSSLIVLLVVCALPFAGCAAGQTDTDSAPASSGSLTHSQPQASTTTKRAPPHGSNGDGLVYSSASASTVQRQPAPGSCHAQGRGLYSRPDPRCTPGALNPDVTQATIDQTICQQGWTSTVRPPASITEQEKSQSMAAYGDSGSLGDYEYDHLVPLELGGAVNDPRNLWPEPGASTNPKDSVEDQLRQEVCDRQMTLAQAQRAITQNWVKLTAGVPGAAPGGGSGSAPAPSPASAAGGQCTASASYSSRYHDYDVYVHSNQPGETVTVSDASGRQASWHTDSSGYADVYFKAPSDASGETVTARVGSAVCQTTV